MCRMFSLSFNFTPKGCYRTNFPPLRPFKIVPKDWKSNLKSIFTEKRKKVHMTEKSKQPKAYSQRVIINFRNSRWQALPLLASKCCMYDTRDHSKQFLRATIRQGIIEYLRYTLRKALLGSRKLGLLKDVLRKWVWSKCFHVGTSIVCSSFWWFHWTLIHLMESLVI